VARNARRPREGEKVTCRNCNQKYFFRQRPVDVRPLLDLVTAQQETLAEKTAVFSSSASFGSGYSHHSATVHADGFLIPGLHHSSTGLRRDPNSWGGHMRDSMVAALGTMVIHPSGEPTRPSCTHAFYHLCRPPPFSLFSKYLSCCLKSWVACGSHLPACLAFCFLCPSPPRSPSPSDLCAERLDRKHVPNLVLKDNDLNYRLVLDPEVAEETTKQLERNSAFLAAQNIMDFSLLIGVHNERHRFPDPTAPTTRPSAAGWGRAVVPPSSRSHAGARPRTSRVPRYTISVSSTSSKSGPG